MRPRFTFTIRSLLAAVAVIAMLLVAVPTTYRWYKWSETREMLNEWAAGLDRKANHYEGWCRQLPNGRHVCVSTSEVEIADDFSTFTTRAGTPIRPIGFYVSPPGIWVETIDDVIRTWERFD